MRRTAPSGGPVRRPAAPLRRPFRRRGLVLTALVLALAALRCSGPDAAVDEPAAASTSVPRSAPPAFYLGGIQVNEDDHQRWLDGLQAAKMNTVSVTDYAHQGDWDSDNLWWDEENPGLLAEIRAAKARGVQVVLILRVALDHAFPRNEFLWHGMIMPQSDALIDSWFAKYTRFALRWAEIAEQEGVDVLMIGSEMNALTSTLPLAAPPALEEYYLDEAKQAERKARMLRHGEVIEERALWMPGRDAYPDLERYLEARIATEEAWAAQVAGERALALGELNRRRRLLDDRWRGLIAKVRAAYGGPLGYAANFDQYQMVGFWDELDVMGINAYFKLRDRLLPQGTDTAALYPLLRTGWQGVLGDIAAFRAAQGLAEQPVIFTEMGFTWRAESTLEPWSDTGFSLIESEGEERMIVWRDQPENLEERALAVRALYDALRALPEPFLKGILYWKLSTVPSHRDIESFVLILGQDPPDPLLAELQRFVDAPLGAP